ncbi:NADH-quinone oxidoreductase subunit C [Clostridium polynesiense]|uniref:NADH-quinone oxidoreductase subunit C n=1 Tax=Clostridium polynesiense TaxID=1325933 RepID=UPI00058BD996|nr:NADH-quinone oxidoreductase subunit C [Clostridium polynesiense]
MHEYQCTEITKDELIPIVKKMYKEKRRLVIMNGYIDKEGNNVVLYHFDVEGSIKSYSVRGFSIIPSITEIYGGSAQWCEEEICEFMPIDFQGLNKSGRLFLPEEFDGSGQILVLPLSELKKYKEAETSGKEK